MIETRFHFLFEFCVFSVWGVTQIFAWSVSFRLASLWHASSWWSSWWETRRSLVDQSLRSGTQTCYRHHKLLASLTHAFGGSSITRSHGSVMAQGLSHAQAYGPSVFLASSPRVFRSCAARAKSSPCLWHHQGLSRRAAPGLRGKMVTAHARAVFLTTTDSSSTSLSSNSLSRKHISRQDKK